MPKKRQGFSGRRNARCRNRKRPQETGLGGARRPLAPTREANRARGGGGQIPVQADLQETHGQCNQKASESNRANPLNTQNTSKGNVILPLEVWRFKPFLIYWLTLLSAWTWHPALRKKTAHSIHHLTPSIPLGNRWLCRQKKDEPFGSAEPLVMCAGRTGELLYAPHSSEVQRSWRSHPTASLGTTSLHPHDPSWGPLLPLGAVEGSGIPPKSKDHQ